MNQIQSKKEYLNMKGISQYTSLSPSTIHRAIKAGKLHYFQPGRKLLFKVVDVDRWISGN
jgi:excisionase family DNA binding protein